MALEEPGSRELNGNLPCSVAEVSTFFVGSYFDSFKIRGEDIPASMEIRDHIFNIEGQLYVGMADAVEMIGEKLEEPVLEEAIAVSGLYMHLGSMEPELGGSLLNRELNAEFLAPAKELEPLRPPTDWGRPEEYSGNGPYVSFGTRYAQARVSVYDFPKMVSYTMSNTALQHTINLANLGRTPQDTDPRLTLIEAARSAAVAA